MCEQCRVNKGKFEDVFAIIYSRKIGVPNGGKLKELEIR